MLFNSLVFLFAFLPLALLGHWAIPSNRGKNAFLFLISLFFYFAGEGYLTAVLIFSVSFNFLLALGIEKIPDERVRQRKAVLLFGIAGNLLPLLVYKYFGFIRDNIESSGLFGEGPILDNWQFVLPIGISFFTFQALSYLIDVYRKKVRAHASFISLGLYISLFPQLIAGPIVRYSTISNQIANRVVSAQSFSRGLMRFIEGLAKKVLLADPMAEVADSIFALPPEQLTSGLAWLAAASYMLQIYFDFSGYSDMAIGLGRMFGFRFLENFRHPYMAQSIREFWRRWHISLSSWFRDYLYIPLGGNRGSGLSTIRNLFIVFSFCGLWHGASWNFFLWGLAHGVLLSLERLDRVEEVFQKLGVTRRIYVIVFLLLTWVLFRAETLDGALLFYERMLLLSHASNPILLGVDYLDMKFITLFLLGCMVSIKPMLVTSQSRHLWKSSWRHPIGQSFLLLAYLALFVTSVLQVVAGNYSPFIYFRF